MSDSACFSPGVPGFSRPATQSARDRTILRIGLVFEDRLISDRVFDDRRPVSIGQARRDRIVLDSDYRGPSLHLQRCRDGTATLTCSAETALRFALPGFTTGDLTDLRRQGAAAASRDGEVTLHLSLGSRGRLRLGPYTVLVQVLRQRLPARVRLNRGLFVEAIHGVWADPVWSLSLGLAALLVCGVLAQALLFHRHTTQFLHRVVMPEVAEPTRWLAPTIAPRPVTPLPKPVAAAAAPAAAVSARPPSASPPPLALKPHPAAHRRGDKRRQVRRVAPRGASGGSAKAAGSLRRRSLAGAFGGTHGGLVLAAEDEADPQVFGGSPELGGARPGQDGPGAGHGLRLRGDVGQPAVAKIAVGRARIGPRKAHIGSRRVERRAPRVRVQLTRTHGDPQLFNPKGQAVARVLARKRRAVQRCYEQALRETPSLSTKVRVVFTVGTGGTITRATVRGATGKLRSCIRSIFLRARGLPVLSAPQQFRQGFVLTPGG